MVVFSSTRRRGTSASLLRQILHSYCYLKELVDLHLAVLVEVHLIQDLMQRVLINMDVYVLRRRRDDWSTAASELFGRQIVKMAVTHIQDSLDVHSGDEAFSLLVKLMEALLVPVA